jgi:hypothetical protein
MTTMISEVYDALRSIGIDEPNARYAVALLLHRASGNGL